MSNKEIKSNKEITERIRNIMLNLDKRKLEQEQNHINSLEISWKP